LAKRILSEAWAVDVCIRATVLRSQLSVATAAAPAGPEPERRAIAESVEALLDRAEHAIERGRAGLGQRGLVARWRGTSIGLAYQSLHAAEVLLAPLMTDEQIDAVVPSVVNRVRTVLDPADPRRVAIDQLPQRVANRAPGSRTALQQAMNIGYDAGDAMHVRVRNFRNLLITSAVLIILLMAGLVWVVALHPEAMPMCFAKGTTEATSQNARLTICPSGAAHPTGGDMLIVTGLGLLGGALAAAFSIRNVRGTSTPYDVPIALALLKPPLGALTAVTSILLLGGDFVPGLSQLDSQRQILAYALVFGYAQQLVSRLIDDQGHSILNSLPSKDPDGKKPSASVASEPDPNPDPVTGPGTGDPGTGDPGTGDPGTGDPGGGGVVAGVRRAIRGGRR
jgi:hypothetical protein